MTYRASPIPSLDDDKPHEECGIFGIFEHPDAAALTALGLHALQHRGQEAAGIVTFDGRQFHSHRALGHVGENFGEEDVISRLPGTGAIGLERNDHVVRWHPVASPFVFGRKPDGRKP